MLIGYRNMSEWNSEKIKKLRKSLGLSQAEFAHRLGCRQQTVSEWEKGMYLPANAYGRLLESMLRSQPRVLNEQQPPFFKAALHDEVSTDAYPANKPFDPAVD